MTIVAKQHVPYSVKLLYSAFVAIVVQLYWVTYGPWNFLYFCDVALLVTAMAIWIDGCTERQAGERRNQLIDRRTTFNVQFGITVTSYRPNDNR